MEDLSEPDTPQGRRTRFIHGLNGVLRSWTLHECLAGGSFQMGFHSFTSPVAEAILMVTLSDVIAGIVRLADVKKTRKSENLVAEMFIEDSLLPPVAEAAARDELARLTAVLPPFMFMRNKALSHADLSVSLKLELPPVQLKDVDFAIERFKAIVKISEAHHGSELTTEGGGSLFDEDEFRGKSELLFKAMMRMSTADK